MLTPGPDHPITLEPAKRRWRAYFNHHVIADTADALILQEANLPPVVYFPRADVGMEYMGRTERRTECPYKGEASYYTLRMGDEIAENVAWSYEDPHTAVGDIAGRIAFYTDQVEVYEVDEAALDARRREAFRGGELPRPDERVTPQTREDIDEVVQHTDAGDGTSQREHWAANVETPRGEEGGLR